MVFDASLGPHMYTALFTSDKCCYLYKNQRSMCSQGADARVCSPRCCVVHMSMDARVCGRIPACMHLCKWLRVAQLVISEGDRQVWHRG